MFYFILNGTVCMLTASLPSFISECVVCYWPLYINPIDLLLR